MIGALVIGAFLIFVLVVFIIDMYWNDRSQTKELIRLCTDVTSELEKKIGDLKREIEESGG